MKDEKEQLIVKLTLIKKIVHTGENLITYFDIYRLSQNFSENIGEPISLSQTRLQNFILENFDVVENRFIAKKQILLECAKLDLSLSEKEKVAFKKVLRNYFCSLDDVVSINKKVLNQKNKRLICEIINKWQPSCYNKCKKDFSFLKSSKTTVIG